MGRLDPIALARRQVPRRKYVLDEKMSIHSYIGCLAALAWIVITVAGCTEQKSTGSAAEQSVATDFIPDETTVTRISGDVGSHDPTISTPKKSDGCGTAIAAPGAHNLVMEHGGWERNSVMVVPESATRQSLAHPLLIVMHGFGGSGAGMRNGIGRNSGIEDGRVVLYPDGAGSTGNMRGWNSGHPKCCGTALHNNVDDVAFLRELVNVVAQKTCIDLNRVYATGFSNGGDMAQRLACDASDVVAAVASVAGRFDYHSSACNGERPVPTVLFRGARDRTVPYKSSLLGLAAIKTIPAMEGFEQIARNHECRGKPYNTLSAGGTDCLRFSNCQPGYEITLCTSADAGHCWPGINNCPRTREGGGEVFSASEYMQEFFVRHALSP